jgi:putative PIN family toxin of toxin-antitoxin system
MRIVLDTNVLIAAFYEPLRGPSFSKDVFDYVVEKETVVLSPDIIEEFQNKCSKKLKMPAVLIKNLVALLMRKTETVRPTPPSFDNVPLVLRDPKDRHILALTLTVKADLLLTWDKDLLTLGEVGPTRILTPREFWDEVGQ